MTSTSREMVLRKQHYCHTRLWLTDLTEAESSYIIGLDRPPHSLRNLDHIACATHPTHHIACATHPSWEWIDFYYLETLLTNQTSLTLHHAMPCHSSFGQSTFLIKQLLDKATYGQSNFLTKQLFDKAAFWQTNFWTNQLLDKATFVQSIKQGADGPKI